MEYVTTGGLPGWATHPAVNAFLAWLAVDIPALEHRYLQARNYVWEYGAASERETALLLDNRRALEHVDRDGDRRAVHLTEAVMVALATEVMERYWQEEAAQW